MPFQSKTSSAGYGFEPPCVTKNRRPRFAESGLRCAALRCPPRQAQFYHGFLNSQHPKIERLCNDSPNNGLCSCRQTLCDDEKLSQKPQAFPLDLAVNIASRKALRQVKRFSTKFPADLKTPKTQALCDKAFTIQTALKPLRFHVLPFFDLRQSQRSKRNHKPDTSNPS